MTAAPGETELHHRTYEIRSFRVSADRMRLRGAIHDRKPPGIYIDNDPDPLSVHQMIVDLTVSFPSLEIVGAEVVMEVTPHNGCTTIEPTYSQLVGVSIARGFSRVVRELFGGPRGCTHVGALLQAMAPVAIQSMWSMRAVETPVSLGAPSEADERKKAMAINFNTCHVWDTDGEFVQAILRDEEIEPPLWATKRLVELGRSPEEWREG